MRYLLGVVLVATGILALPMSLVILVESLAGKAKSGDLIAGGCFLFGGIAMFLVGMRLVRAVEERENKERKLNPLKESRDSLETKPDEYLPPEDKFATFDLSQIFQLTTIGRFDWLVQPHSLHVLAATGCSSVCWQDLASVYSGNRRTDKR